MSEIEIYDIIVEQVAVLRKGRHPQCILHRDLIEALTGRADCPSPDELYQIVQRLADAGKIEIRPTINDVSYYVLQK